MQIASRLMSAFTRQIFSEGSFAISVSSMEAGTT